MGAQPVAYSLTAHTVFVQESIHMGEKPLIPIAVASLSHARETHVEFDVPHETLKALRDQLDLIDLRKPSFKITMSPKGRQDWVLSGHLGITAVQPCSLTLAPVATRIEEDFQRSYMSRMPEHSDGGEMEMPHDESLEPLPEVIDPVEILAETLALALPAFPRAKGAELGEAVFTEPGKDAMTDEAARPFAGLAALRDQSKD